MTAGLPEFLCSVEPENWKFDKLLDSEVEECFLYEIGRESAKIRDRISRFRKKVYGSSFEELLSIASSGFATVRGFSPRWRGISPYCPEFPEWPFLKIPSKERKRRIGLYKPTQAIVEMRACMFEADLARLLSVFDTRDMVRGVIVPEPGFTIAAFRIDWSLSDKQLLDEWKNWLRMRRSELSDKKVVEKRGAGSALRQMRSGLKGLGASRLLRRLGYEKAANLSAKHSHDGETPLYDDQPGWLRAQRETKKLVASMAVIKNA